MNSGILCFTSTKRAGSFKNQPEELITDWRKYQILAGTPDKIVKLEIISNDGNEPFSGAVNNSSGNNTGGITAKSHTHT